MAHELATAALRTTAIEMETIGIGTGQLSSQQFLGLELLHRFVLAAQRAGRFAEFAITS